MLSAIEQKMAGQEITAAPQEPQAQIIDLMEALKASLAGAGDKRKPAQRAHLKASEKKKRTSGKKAARRARG